MTYNSKPFGRNLFVVCLLSNFLYISGCATQEPLYYWGDYQPQVYEYLKNQGGNPAEQILTLEKVIQLAKAKNKRLPPGFYAHLGMLQFSEGQFDLARDKFEMERELYPESTVYMSFLIAKLTEEKK